MWVLTAAEVRAADRHAIEAVGIPGLLLMEHAAAAVADAVWGRLVLGSGAGMGPRGGPGAGGRGGFWAAPDAGNERAGGLGFGRVFIVTGPGNNGGDGLAAARLLHGRAAGYLPERVAAHSARRGADRRDGALQLTVLAVVPPEKLQGDAAENARMLRAAGVEIDTFTPEALADAGAGDVVVDALLGTGLSRAPEGLFATAIAAMRAARERGAWVLAVDLPSGVDADTGQTPGSVVAADRTLTFGALKRGLLAYPGAGCAGAVEVVDIGWPPSVWEQVDRSVRVLTEWEVRARLAPRPSDSHKGSFGRCLIVAGSEGKSGAAALAGLGALRAGAGTVTIASRPRALPQILATAPEMMAHRLPSGGSAAGSEPLSLADADALLEAAHDADAVGIGPGIPRGEETGELIGRLLRELEVPMVLDADALNALAGKLELLDGAKKTAILTPHPKEMARLLGVSAADVQASRFTLAQRLATRHRCVVVLKGAHTLVAMPDGALAVCPTGNPGMATGGSGDVLTGILVALLGQGLPVEAAAQVGVYVHGLAGDVMAKEKGQRGLIASDLCEGLSRVWSEWDR